MAKTMRAGVVHAFGKPLSIEEIPIPTPGPGEVLIKVIASGVCQTDVRLAGRWASTGRWARAAKKHPLDA